MRNLTSPGAKAPLTMFLLLLSFISFGQYNPMAGTNGFSIVSRGDIEMASGEIEGGIATLGKVRLKGTTQVGVNTSGTFIAAGDSYPTVVIAEGGFMYESGNGLKVLGNSFIKVKDMSGSKLWSTAKVLTNILSLSSSTFPRVEMNVTQSQTSIEQDVYDFSGNFTTFEQYSSELASCTENVTLTDLGANKFRLNLTSGKTNVLSVTKSELQSASAEISFSITPSSSTPVVVNVDLQGSSKFDWYVPNMPGIPNSAGKYIIWNFYNGTDLNLYGSTLIGSILAPKINVCKIGSANIEGQVVANYFTMDAGEVHYQVFSANVDCSTQTFVCACTSSNLIQNGDFSINLNNWTAPQGQFGLYSGGPSGNYAILNNGDANNDYTVYQDVSIGGNTNYRFTALTARHGGTNSYMKLIFYNGSTIIQETSPAYTQLTYPDFREVKFEGTTPANTTKVRVFGFARGTALKFDSVVLTKCFGNVNLVQGNSTKPTCGFNDGTIVVTATGGSGNFQYRINGGAYQASNSFSNLGQGSYTVEVKDLESSCSKTLQIQLDCEDRCTNTFSNPDPAEAEVNPSQSFGLSVGTNAANGTQVEWFRSTQNVTSFNALTSKTSVGVASVSNGVASITVNAPSTLGTYYYYAVFKPIDPCGTFAKHKITVRNIGTNDPVCLSGSRILTDNLRLGACQTNASIYYSLWLDMNSSSGKPNYQHFTTSGLKFEEYCDGTAKIFGTVCAVGGGANDCLEVEYLLSGRTATTPQNSPKANSCTTYGNDLYYYVNATGTISGKSGGIYNGLQITISDNNSNSIPAFQVGTGANVNTNGFGASGWYNLSFNNAGTNGWSAKTSHGDFNFNLGELIPFELEASTSASIVCVDGSVTLNAQFKGEVPIACSPSYSWSKPGGGTETGQSITLDNVQTSQAGIYTVTATFTSNGKTCSATSTVNLTVDTNCESTPVCLPVCDNSTLVYWNLNQCNTGTGGNWYGEFEPQINLSGCADIEATTIYRVNPDHNKHSCATGPDGSDAMCVDGVSSTTKPGNHDDKAVRFSTTISPGVGKTYNLAELSFKYKRSGYQCSTGGSQTLVLYVYKNGTQVYEEVITGLTTSWKSKTIDFGGKLDFVSDAPSTYDFEIVGYNPTGGCTVWEIDEVKLNGCCGEAVSKPIINVSSAYICLGETVDLSVDNCNGTISWSTGSSASSISVTPTETTSYTVTCSIGGCTAEKSVTVTVDPDCNNNVCLTCDPKTVVKWNLDECLALYEAYSYSEFLPEYPNTANFDWISASNIYRSNPDHNPHSCVVGFTGNANVDRAMCVSANTGYYADWSKAVKFNATLNPSQIGALTALRFNQRAAYVLNYSPQPASSGGTAYNNYPTKYAVRIYKEGVLVYESLDRSTNPTNWTTEFIDLSNDPNFEITATTKFSFELTAYRQVGNGKDKSVWDLDNIEIIACTQSEEVTASATSDAEKCEGEVVNLTATSSASNASYSWTGPAGFTPQTGSTATTTVAGTYTVTVTTSTNCTATATTFVEFKEPPTGGEIGYNEEECGPYDAQEIVSVVDPTGEDCGPFIVTGEDACDNGDKPYKFVLQFNGGTCEESNNHQGDIGGKWNCTGSGTFGSSAYISVNNGQFSGTVNLNEEFTVENGGSNLTNPIVVSLYDQQGGTLLQTVTIHTSCSAPIVLGDQFGSLVLTEAYFSNGYSETATTGMAYSWEKRKEGGNWVVIPGATGLTYEPGLITMTTEYRRVTTNCCGTDYSNVVVKKVNPEIYVSAGDDEVLCDGGDAELTAVVSSFGFASNGFILKSQNESSPTEDRSKFEKDGAGAPRLIIEIEGNPTPITIYSSKAARIESSEGHWDHNHDDPAVGYDGSEYDRTLVGFDLSGITGTVKSAQLVLKSKESLGATVGVYPVSEVWNADEVTWRERDKNIEWGTLGEWRPSDPLLDVQTISVNQDYSWDVTEAVETWVNGPVPLSGNYSYLWSTGQTTQTITVSPLVTTTYTVTITDLETGCKDTDEVVVEVTDQTLDPGVIGENQENCGPFDPEVLTSVEDATGDCNITTVEDCCDSGDKPSSITLKYIGGSCATSSNHQGSLGGKWDCTGGDLNNQKVYIIANNGMFAGYVDLGTSFTVSNGGSSLGSTTTINIYDTQGGNLLQTVKVHTSCSAPLVNGDTFGALELLSTEFVNGFYCESVNNGIEYQWQVFENGTWVNIPGAVSESYDPPFTSKTISYRRNATNCCGTLSSNEVTITVHDTLKLQISSTDIDCNGDATGTATVTVDQGKAPFVYNWSNGNSTSTITDLLAGIYSVTVTDANGCSATASVEVIQSPLLVVNVEDVKIDCFGDLDASLTANVTGGTPIYSYTWSTSPVQNQQVATGLGVGTYTVTVTDVKGCSATASAVVTADTCGSIGSTVWADEDNDGIIDSGEKGLANVKVSLYDGSNNFITSVLTDANGNYYFDKLLPGDYQVKILGADLPGGYQSASYVTDDSEESDGNNNGSQTNLGDDIVSQIITLEPGGEPTGSDELLGNNDNQIGGAQDDAKDAYGDMTVDFGLIRNPDIDLKKTVASITPLGDNTFEITYQIVVDNDGVATGSYSLIDSPDFDDDITINSAAYTSNAPGYAGGPLAGTGPWNLSTSVDLGGGLSHTYEIKVNATIDLKGSGGDDTYSECSPTGGDIYQSGSGLFNVAAITLNDLTVKKDTACGDLPFIQHTKTLSTITPNGNNEYTITYDIVVENIGGAEGTYGLKDDPSFEDDITILEASYTTTSGVPTVALYPTDAVWTLASGVNLGAGASHSYTVSVDVKIDLSTGSTGDNTYTACGSTATSTEFAAGEGLFNESILTDLNGLEIERDTACGDLPYITHAKTLSSITDLGDNTFSVLYEIEVKNLGGAVSSYTLEDAGSFEDDITIIDGGYSSPEIGAYAFTGNPFPLTITSGNTIAAGATETYQLQVKVAIDLTDGQVGDDVYTACGETSTMTEYSAGEGLFNESILKDSEGMVIEKDTACGDLPFIQHTKTLSTITPNGNNEYTITYDIVVENIGGAEGTYGLKDDPSFEDDITILDASYTTTSGVPTVALYPTDAVWTLASGVNLGAGASHSYTVSVDVKIDLSAGSTGDNTYTACGSTATSTEFAAGEGLFNESILTDLNGLEIERDTACGDLPYIVHTKVASNRTQIDRDEYTIEYTILVENKGGAKGVYGLNDQPGFDDDIEIQSVSYTTDAGVTPNILSAGDAVWNLSQDVNLGIGQTHTYTLTVDILYNLEEGSSGDNVYTECSSQTGTDTFTKGEGLFNESVLLDLNEFEIDRDTACIDLLAALGDTVFVDINGNGIQDPTESGLAGVEVKLNGTVNGNPITEQTAFTDVNGFYEFIGLEPGDYVVTFPTSADINGLSGTLTDDDATGGNTDGTDTNEDSDADQTIGETETYTLSYGEFEPRADAGYYVPASLGDTVFVDVNGNGLQDAGEPGIEGVEVTLTGTTGSGEAVTATTTTDANGFYEFTGLQPGDYYVTFPTTAQVGGNTAELTDEDVTGGNDDATDTNEDSDADQATGETETVTLESGEDEVRLDAGYYVPASLGDTVFVDVNGNGLQDAGEPGIEGVEVTLTGTTGSGEAVTATTTTDANGFYEFTGLQPGEYYVTFPTTAQVGGNTAELTDEDVTGGNDDATDTNEDSDADQATGETETVTLVSGEHDPRLDAGYYVPASLGDTVFVDVNGNGLQDAGEPGIEGVEVTLTGTTGSGEAVTATTTTMPMASMSLQVFNRETTM